MDQIEELLTRGVEKIYPSRTDLEKVLRSGKKIRLYNGIDPSGPHLHLGHMVVLRKLRQFQDLGHQVILLIGDFTGMIGDPTAKKAARKRLSRKQVLENSRDYQKQASKILRFSGSNSVKIRLNSEWLSKLTFKDVVELASYFTAPQMWERDMFQERLKRGKEVWLHEFLYPLMQAYDSVALDVDLEVGGTDQTFNMLCGRTLLRVLKGKEKFVLTIPLLAEPGKEKMGKTEGNLIALNENPNEIFGKIMAWSDGMIRLGFELLTNVPREEVQEMEKQMKSGKVNPMDLKKRLAKEIVTQLHSEEKAKRAQEEFERVFQKGKAPLYDILIYDIKPGKVKIIDLLVKSKLVSSKSEAKRLVEQKAVEIDNQLITDCELPIAVKNGAVVKVGKRKFLKLEVSS